MVNPFSMSLKRSFSLFIFALLLTNLFLPTFSAPVVDPNAPIGFQPSIFSPVTNGYVINIVNPDSNGLSHNKYSEFNAASIESIIFNNSTTGGNTQLLNLSLLANPNLTSGSASTILNEVTGLNKSILNGSFEIFGVKANLIFANPNGISLNGASFINTGTLNFIAGVYPPAPLQGGALSYTPTGNIDIGINGLNASNTDGLGFFAQQIVNNGNITGPNAKAPVNLQMVDYHSIDSNVVPGRIFVPMDSKGNVYGTKMDDLKMNVHNADQWEIADGKLQMKAGNIQNNGNIIANNNLILESNQFQNTGNINNTAGDTVITARAANSGVQNTGTINSVGNLSIIADSVLNNGNLKSNTDINILATGENSVVRSKGDQRVIHQIGANPIPNAGIETISYGIWNEGLERGIPNSANIESDNINLLASSIRNTNSDIFALNNLQISGGDLVNERTGFYTDYQYIDLNPGAGRGRRSERQIWTDKVAGGREAYLGAANNLDININGNVLNKASLLEAGNDLNVKGNNFTNEKIILQQSINNRWERRRAFGIVNVRNTYQTNSRSSVNSGVFASGDANFDLTGDFRNTGRIDIDQNLSINATNIINGITDPNIKTP
ncbi:MAG: filamentous hemagglutinin N-terminal domain-containing protein, partial [Candidatus Melainabacteria bacterium]